MAVAVLACLLVAPHADARPYLPGEAIVRFEPNASGRERSEARKAAGAEAARGLGLPRAQVVEVEGSVARAVRRLKRQPGVAYAQPNYRYQALAVEPPDDTFFGKLWGLEDPALPNPGVSVLEAWEESKGAGETIAVLDTGVDLTHPDIVPNLWTNPSPDPKANDLHGFDFVDEDGDPDDYEFHGTHVAGTAAAVADNGQGIAGVAPKAEIMAVRVLDGDGSGSSAGIAAGIAYAAEHGAGVINMSLGGPAGGDPTMSNAVSLAASQDVVVVVAAGNEGTDNDVRPTVPCTLPQANLICVAALSQGSGGLASFSNFGAKSVDLAAPGTSILSAKVDYGAPLFSNGFETGETGAWGTLASNGGVQWGLSSPGSSSSPQAATDSPSGKKYGHSIDPTKPAISELLTVDPVDLGGERGCRIHFQAKYQVEKSFDAFLAGAADEGSSLDLHRFDGTSSAYPGGFELKEASISEFDGASDVHPVFILASGEKTDLDGAYVDEVRLICRDETYLDAISSFSQYDQADAGSYVSFQGTSMATPHVAGIAALVRAAAPGASATQVVDAILTGASALPKDDPSKPTVTHGIADACQAIAVATGADFAVECPGSSENTIPPPAIPIPGVQTGSTTQPTVDTTRPRTSFGKHPLHLVRTRSEKARVIFRFHSNEAGSTFVCKIDAGLWRFCGARLVKRFPVGRHAVQVKARDAAGNVDRTPAVFRFRVERIG